MKGLSLAVGLVTRVREELEYGPELILIL